MIVAQGHIRPQGEGSWEIKFDLGRDPLSGRRITKYVTFQGTKTGVEYGIVAEIVAFRIDDFALFHSLDHVWQTVTHTLIRHCRSGRRPLTHRRAELA